MTRRSLPARPDLEQLRKQAKELVRAHAARDEAALERIAEHLPAVHGRSPEAIALSRFALHDAQSVVAREHGFASWPELVAEVERRTLSFEQRVDEFLLAATDGRIDRAQRLLADEPALGTANLYCAAVLGDLERLRAGLDRDATLTTKRGGPRANWDPLLYLSFSRFHRVDAGRAAGLLACARELLARGADPNTHYFDPEFPNSPLAALYGACGESDHPALARLLLAAGADPNDGESVYHAAEHFHRECLEVLAEFRVDLNTPHRNWGNVPLFFVLGYQEFNGNWPAALQGVRWLLAHGADPNVASGKEQETSLHVAVRGRHGVALIELLLAHGADPNRARADGKTPMRLADESGQIAIAEAMRRAGGRDVALGAVERFLAACFAGDGRAARRIELEHPGLRAEMSEDQRLSLVAAARTNDVPAIEAMIAVGFDPNAKGEAGWGGAPLHSAAWCGALEAARTLLAHGALVDAEANPPFRGTPLQWAAHGSTNCRNPAGDYPELARALVRAGARVTSYFPELASPEVVEALRDEHVRRGW